MSDNSVKNTRSDLHALGSIKETFPKKNSRKKGLKIRFENDYYYLVLPDGKELKYSNEELLENAIKKYSKEGKI